MKSLTLAVGVGLLLVASYAVGYRCGTLDTQTIAIARAKRIAEKEFDEWLRGSNRVAAIRERSEYERGFAKGSGYRPE